MTGPDEHDHDHEHEHEQDHDDAPDLAAARTLIAEQRARVEAATDVDARVLFGAWGTAWLVGFTALWLALREDPVLARQAGFAVFGVMLTAAAVVTAVHLAHRSSGVRGGSAVQGAMYGWAWFLAFLGVFALGAGLDRAGASFPLVAHVQTVVSALLVAALYMAGGAMWGDRTQFVLGAWIAVVTAVGAVAGPPHTLLVMALAGGGGMLVAALADHLRRVRRNPGALP